MQGGLLVIAQEGAPKEVFVIHLIGFNGDHFVSLFCIFEEGIPRLILGGDKAQASHDDEAGFGPS